MALFKITDQGAEWWVDSPTMEHAIRRWRDETDNRPESLEPHPHPGPDLCAIVTIDDVLRVED